jgi:glycosyltransferase involved in cell wall biosynthesis
MIKLSVIIPTFKRRDRLKKSLSNYIEEKINTVEFLVIDNSSNDGTEDLVQLMIKEDHRIKYFKNPQNLGYNRNLYRGYLEAKSNWICILPDDDAIEKGYLSELVELQEKNQDCSIIISAQKSENGLNQIYSDKTHRLKAGTFEALKTAFTLSGAVTGFSFNIKKIDQTLWKLDNRIYPQIEIAVFAALKNDIIYFIPKNYPIVGVGDPITIRLNDYMNRPSDFGVFERLEILNEVSKDVKKEIRFKLIHYGSTNLINWTLNLAIKIYRTNPTLGFEYLKILSKNKHIKGSSIFLGLLAKQFLVNEKLNIVYRFKIICLVLFRGIAFLRKKNFYTDFWYFFKYRI